MALPAALVLTYVCCGLGAPCTTSVAVFRVMAGMLPVALLGLKKMAGGAG